MPAADDDTAAVEARLASATEMVTTAVQVTWMRQTQIGEGISEQVRDAVITLVTERSPRTKYRVIAEHTQLLSHAAERLLDLTLDFVRALPQPHPSHIQFFNGHLDMIRLVRACDVDLDQVPEQRLKVGDREAILAEAQAIEPQSARDYDDRARTLRDRGHLEETKGAFTEAIRLVRADGDAAVEGRAEIGLVVLVMKTSAPGPAATSGCSSTRGADAYPRADDRAASATRWSP